jgi:hypothetical protein
VVVVSVPGPAAADGNVGRNTAAKPDDPDYTAAVTAIKADSFARAIPIYQKALAIDPKHCGARVQHRPERRRRRVGHEDVEATEGLADPLDDGDDGVRLSEVEGQGEGAPTKALDLLGRLVPGGGVAAVGDRAIGAGSREREGDGAPHAPRAAGDDGDAPGEPAHLRNFRKSTGRFSTNAFRPSIASSVW